MSVNTNNATRLSPRYFMVCVKVMFCLVLVCGCEHVFRDTDVDIDDVNNLRSGVSTRSDVTSMIGPPTLKTTLIRSGKEYDKWTFAAHRLSDDRKKGDLVLLFDGQGVLFAIERGF